MRISRPCYDKYRRCPGWAGSGMRFAHVKRCDNGFLDVSDSRYWQLMLHRCSQCGLTVFPSHVRWLDPTWYRWYLPFKFKTWLDDYRYRRARRLK